MEENAKLNDILILTVGYFFIEIIGGLHYNSLSLVTDAAFMAINIAGQLLAIYVQYISKKKPDEDNPFGYERAKVLSGLINGMLVGFVLFYVLVETYHRLMNPVPIGTNMVLLIAVVGFAVNGYGVLRLRNQTSDLNIKGAYIHLLTDLLGSVGVVISMILVGMTGIMQIDAVAGLLIGLLSAYPTYFLIRDSIHILMEGAPIEIKKPDVEEYIGHHFFGIRDIKGLRMWCITPDKPLMAVRVRTDGHVYNRESIKSLKRGLKTKFGFVDVYIEVYESKEAFNSTELIG
jgi:cobalt-zinc-cadmium efflux system protein